MNNRHAYFSFKLKHYFCFLFALNKGICQGKAADVGVGGEHLNFLFM